MHNLVFPRLKYAEIKLEMHKAWNHDKTQTLSSNNVNNKKEKMRDWRRNIVQQLLVRGYSQWDIADELQIDQSTVSRDIQCLRQQASENLKSHIQNKLPEEYQRCLTGLN